MTRTDLPSIKRVCLAMVLGPLVASALYSIYTFGLDLRYFWAFIAVLAVGAFPPTLFLAIPIYVIVRDHGRLSPIFVCVTAGLIAVTPWFLLELLLSNGRSSFSFNNVLLVQDGVLTAAGRLQQTRTYAAKFLAGALGGAIFWLIAMRHLPRHERQHIGAVHPAVPDGDRSA